MTKALKFLVPLLMVQCLYAAGQKIQYSRQAAMINYPDAVQLVANISGYHHLVCFTLKKKPVVYIFDQQLRLVSENEMPFKLASDYEIKLIPFKNFYYIYTHAALSHKHELWKVDGTGNIRSLTTAFDQLIKNNLVKSTAALQLSNVDGKLYVVSHTWFRELEKVTTTVMEADTALNVLWKQMPSYAYSGMMDKLQQVNVVNRHKMLVLKSSRDGSNNTLELLKVNLDSATVFGTTYSSTYNMYVEPAFIYDAVDSSITVYSMIREAMYGGRVRSVFISQLDNNLHEKVPITILKSQFRNNTYVNFLLLNGKSPRWIGMYGNRNTFAVYRQSTSGTNHQSMDADQLYTGGASLLNVKTNDYRNDRYQPTAVRFSLLNSRFKVIKDSLFANDNEKYNIQPQQFARFQVNNKGYLLLNQEFKGNRHGLLLVYSNDQNLVEANDVRVNDRYDYLLPQLQPLSDGAVILPYIYKREAGLLKLTLDN